MDKTKQTPTILNPGREEVRELVATALNSSKGDPAQTFADTLMAMCQIGYMAEVNMTNIEEMVKQAMPNAVIAGDYVIKMINEGSTNDS